MRRRNRIDTGKRSKYGAVRTEADGIKFASKREAKRYGELKLLEKAGVIFGLRCQPKLTLEAPIGFDPPARKVVGYYIADFVYAQPYEVGKPLQQVFEDVKGVRTPLYKWKKKHVEAQYGITVVEV